MASRPFLQKISRVIEQMGGDDWVFDMIADGKPIKFIADRVGCSRPYLYNWRDQKHPDREDRKRKWKEAMARSADARLEDGEQILTDLADRKGPPMPAEVTLAIGRAKYKQETAKMHNPEYSKGGGITVNVDARSLHLDALRQLGGGLKALPVIEATVVEEDH